MDLICLLSVNLRVISPNTGHFSSKKIPTSFSHVNIILKNIKMYCDCCWRWLKHAAWSHVADKLSNAPCQHLGPDKLKPKAWNKIATNHLVCDGRLSDTI